MPELVDYTKKKEMYSVPDEARTFIAKRIMREVEIIAKKKNVSMELAYEMYCKGIWTE